MARKRRKKETSFARRQRREKQENNNSPNLTGFSDFPAEEEKPEIFCKECHEWMNQEDLIHFCKNKFNLEKFSEGSEDEIETITLAELEEIKEKLSKDRIETIILGELEPKNEIKINLAELVKKYEEKQLYIENK